MSVTQTKEFEVGHYSARRLEKLIAAYEGDGWVVVLGTPETIAGNPAKTQRTMRVTYAPPRRHNRRAKR